MDKTETQSATHAPGEFISLQVNDDTVAIQRKEGDASHVSFVNVSSVIASFPDTARFVVEDAGASVGKLLASNQTGSASLIWKILNDNRVVDIGLARRAVQLAAGPIQDQSIPCDTLAAHGAQLWEQMHKAARRNAISSDKVSQFGPLGHGLRVRGMAALAANADRGVGLRPGAREDLIVKCQTRIATLSTALKKFDTKLGGVLGRGCKRPAEIQKMGTSLSSWCDGQLKQLRDAHRSPVYSFRELTKESLSLESDGWPLWALGVPGLSRLATMMAVGRLWGNLEECENDTLRPEYSVSPRLQVTACNLETLPGLAVGKYLEPREGSTFVYISFQPLVATSIAEAATSDGQSSSIVGLLRPGDDPVRHVAELLGEELPATISELARLDWAEALIQYVASGGSWDGLKEFAEVTAGFDTPLTPGEYEEIRRKLCNDFPELGEWLADQMLERVERKFECDAGTLRRLFPQATAAKITEAFATSKNSFGYGTDFPLGGILEKNPDWGYSALRLTDSLQSFKDLCTYTVISPTGFVRTYLPWCASRAEGWRLIFDEAAMNIIGRLTTDGFQLAWASEQGLLLHVPVKVVGPTMAKINQVLTSAVGEVLRLPIQLTASFG